MKEYLEINKKTFVKKFENILDNFYQELQAYIRDPNDENIHDIRVTIRRLESAYRILPKNVRNVKKIRRYVKHAKKLFRINARIRDFDIIRVKMESKYQDKTYDIITMLKNSRKEKLYNANELALKILHLAIPKISTNLLKESKINKRYLKVIDEIELEIQKNMIIVLGDEKKIEELHRLRKDFKKLRYSLELSSNKEKTIQSLKNLKVIQNMLGEIHDNDIIIDHISAIKQNLTYSDIIKSEVLERSNNYHAFVNTISKTKLKSGEFNLQFQY